MRVFLDANVLVTAFASRGLCTDLLEVVLLGQELVLGLHVLREVSKALRGKVKLPAHRAAEIVEFLSGEAVEVVDDSEPSGARVDADDALVLGEAIAGRSEIFVTGDSALLKLGSIPKLDVVSPRRFWERLHAAAP